MADIRSFICIEVPEEILFRLKTLQKRLKGLSDGVRWVRPEGIHLTLKFLGDVDEGRLADVARGIETATRNIQPFEILLGGYGAFPNFRRPRVFWLGIQEDTGVLIRLQRRIEQELEKEGFSPEKRRFTPHLTLGRVKFNENIAKVSQLLSEEDTGADRFRVSEVKLKRSDLLPSGAVYTTLYNIELK
jgi:2'-5' RNA ligase